MWLSVKMIALYTSSHSLSGNYYYCIHSVKSHAVQDVFQFLW